VIVPPAAASRTRSGAAAALWGSVALAAAGCGGGNPFTTYAFDAPAAPPPALAAQPASRSVVATETDGESHSDSRVTPASFTPQEFDPSAAPSAGPLQSGDGFDPSAAPSAGPFQSGDGDMGQEAGDLGSAPGAGADPGTGVIGAPLPPALRSPTSAGDADVLPSTPLLGGRPGAGDGDENLPDLDRPSPEPGPELRLDDVTASALATYPLLAEAQLGRPLANGLVLEAEGAFDTKLKASQDLEPLGFYENYRHAVGVEQPLIGGADLFAGYRIGRGEFEPWYQERQTNDGGEFKAGFTVPLLQDRRIDARRAALRTAALERAAADPIVAAAQLDAVQSASAAYWDWVLAGRLLVVAERLLDLSLDRTEGLEAQVRQGEKAQITLQDNDRLIAARRSKVIDARRKVRQSAAKLSLYLRDADGMPLIPDDALLPARFPNPDGVLAPIEALVGEAQSMRPELATLRIQRDQTVVALSEAQNDLLPELDAGMVVSQDVGGLSSSKGDKQPLELDTAVIFSVPLQRRKARGKAAQLEAKLAQLSVKQRFTGDKVAVEVRLAVAALDAAREQIEQAEISVQLAERLRAAEVKAFELGESDLLILNLREAAAAGAAESLAAARFAYWLAVADLSAAVAGAPVFREPDLP